MARVWQVDDVVVDRRTEFQHVLIGRTAHGTTLFCDDERQSSEATQLVYHEALTVPPLLLADRVDRVLIIGSSEGVASDMAVRHGASVVDHVDIDAEAVRLCAEYLPYGYTREELRTAEAHGGTVRVHYRDGWDFLAEAWEQGVRYDVVLIDLPDESADPQAQHNRLYEADFLRRCSEVLTPGGVVTCQGGCPTMWRNDTLVAAWRRFTQLFGTAVYHGSDEHEWAFLSGRREPLEDPQAAMTARLRAIADTGRGYRPVSIDAETLRAAAVPPHAVRAAVRPSGRR
ncbi:spermidine synthase [Saccharomonospora sp. CUA-673]|uniref:spermidine synthase n=1 Tax=Saccharomonospora sp. CUA-673 TaxID=1904969 RepID=UPI00095ED59F|nr:spermidine synthase [Saccharomonospora sp. CUA-673]OLT42754.1 spermidine synthase [Saccharomonospora sp. CUA-673]